MSDLVRTPPPGVVGDDAQTDYLKDIEPYWFRWADKWWVLPHMRMLDFTVQLKVLKMQTDLADLGENAAALTEAVNELFALLMGPEQADEFAEVTRPLPFLLERMQRWGAHSEITEGLAGESSASTESSSSTGRPSKPTSRPSTGSGSGASSTRGASKTATRRAKSSPSSGG